MSTQLLIYETAVPVNNARHSNWSVETNASYAFSSKVNSVPLMAAEFPPAASEYAIIFSGTDDVIMPAVILGMRGDQNIFLDQQGGWQGKYIPAFIRRYPFVFAGEDSGKTLTLCIDEAFAGCNQEGRGQRLFAEDGKPTPYVDQVLGFLQEYQLQFKRTQAFCKKLQELDLLEPMQAQITLPSGERLSLSGFMAVDRNRLKALPVETLGELAQSDALELIYLHLQSIRNLYNVRDRLVVIQGGKAEQGSQAADAGNKPDEGAQQAAVA